MAEMGKSKLNKNSTNQKFANHAGLIAASNAVLFFVGAVLLVVGITEFSQAQYNNDVQLNIDGTVTSFNTLKLGVCAIYAFLEGAYGALLTTTAGIGAIILAVFGKYTGAYNIMVVAIFCFIMRSLISLFFGGYNCGDNGSGGFPGVYYYMNQQNVGTGSPSSVIPNTTGNTPGFPPLGTTIP
jgi:hypothetical protein